MATRYKIAEIALDTEDIYWVIYYGDVPEQGGMGFGKSAVGFKNIDDAFVFLKEQIDSHLQEYKDIIIKKKERGGDRE